MKLFQLIKLGNADFRARRKTVIHTVLAASIPFVVLFVINLTLAGLENVLLRESGRVTHDEVFLVVSGAKYEDSVNNKTTTLIKEFGGEIVSELEANYAERYAKPMTYLASLAEVDLSKITMQAESFIVNPTPDDFHVLDLVMDGIMYRPPNYNTEDLVESLKESNMYLVKFANVAEAYKFGKYIQDNYLSVGYNEPFSNLLNIYSNFRRIDRQTKIFQIAFVVVAIIIVISSYVYLLDQNVHAMVVYRALGANTRDLLVISLTYLLEVGFCIIACSLMVSSVLALIFSWISAEHLTGVMTSFYNYEPTSVLLWGWSLDMLIVRLTILAAAPVSLLLTLDQFSVQSLMRKLKKES